MADFVGRFSGHQASDFLGRDSLPRKQPEGPITQARNPASSFRPVPHGDSLSHRFVLASSLPVRRGFYVVPPLWFAPSVLPVYAAQSS